MADESHASEMSEYHTPTGGAWYFRQETMLEEFYAQNGNVFPVAWDKYEGRGNKFYGIYDDVYTFYRHLFLLRPECRCGYELIPRETKCKFYADIEWEGEEDKDRSMIKTLIKDIRRYCSPYLPEHQSLELYTSCSSRTNQKTGLYKNSYHIASPTIIFGNNHDGRMESFFRNMCEKKHDVWYYMDEETNRDKCYLDLKVYTLNRCIRLTHCCKLGSLVPFERISGNAFDENDPLMSSFSSDNPLSWLPFILTNPDSNLASVVVASVAETPELIVGRKRRNMTVQDDAVGSSHRFRIDSLFV